MHPSLRSLFVMTASALALGTAYMVERHEQQPVAVLATGTNGGQNVYGETAAMIDRLQDAGYRVVVVPPRYATAAQNTVNRDLRPLREAVLRAAREERLQIIDPQTWYPDGFHIARREAVAIGRRFPNASTFGDSNSVAINEGTGGHCFGVGGMTTTEILAHQFPPAANLPRQACRDISQFRR